jgi:hypothetical protein
MDLSLLETIDACAIASAASVTRGDELIPLPAVASAAHVARSSRGADGAARPAPLLPARGGGLAVPVRGGLGARVARCPERANGPGGVRGLRPARRKALPEPVRRRALAELAGAPQAAQGPVVPLVSAAPVAERVASLVAAVRAGDQGRALLPVGKTGACSRGTKVLLLLRLGLPFQLLPFDEAWREERSDEKNIGADRELHCAR